MRVLLFLVLGVALSAAILDAETKEEFKEFVNKYGKHYSNPVEFAKRQAIFAKNKLKRLVHNLKYVAGETGWEESVNQFSDLTKEEFLSRLGLVLPSNNTDTIPADVYFSSRPQKRFGNIDWRDRGRTRGAQDQGRCGSCWSFAAVASIETCVAIAGGGLLDLSEQQAQDCEHSHRCDPGGGFPSSAMNMAKNGIATEQQYPYTRNDGQCRGPWTSSARVGSIVSGRGENDLERLLQLGAVAVCMDASALQSYSRGVIDAPPGGVNHAVTVVGLTNNCDGRSNQCWIVKNSWGQGWGDGGYFRVVRGKDAMGIATYCDVAVDCKPARNRGNRVGQYGMIDDGFDRLGSDIADTTTKDAEECQLRCFQRQDCQSWVFDECGNKCWLKKGSPAKNDNGCRSSGVVSRSTSTREGKYGPIDDSIDRPGSDIGQTTARNADECQARCYERGDCTSWAFDLCGDRCWLKNGNPGKSYGFCRGSGAIRR